MSEIIPVLVVIGIVILVFLFCREVTLWYLKINETIENQKETNTLLRKILMKLPDEPLKSETLENEAKKAG